MLKDPITAEIFLMDASEASRGVFVATSSGQEFLVKLPSRCGDAGSPYSTANEVIAANLAAAIGVPVLGWEFVEWDGEVGFGITKIARNQFTGMSDQTAEELRTPDVFSAIAAFDLLVCNTDRHSRNLLAIRHREGGYDLIASDHSHCLMREWITPKNLEQFHTQHLKESPQDYFRCPQLRYGVRDCQILSDTLDRIEDVDQDTVVAAVEAVPYLWLPAAEKSLVTHFLQDRAAGIRQLLRGVSSSFPNLGKVP